MLYPTLCRTLHEKEKKIQTLDDKSEGEVKT